MPEDLDPQVPAEHDPHQRKHGPLAAWRFVGEMEKIARSVAGAGLPAGFHDAAREIYERLSDYKDTKTPPTVEEAARKLRRGL